MRVPPAQPAGPAEEDFDRLWLEREMGGYVFFCAHRVVDGCVRECACWAAMEAGRAVDAGMTA